MTKILDFLNANQLGQLGTINNGKPILRPFMFQFEKEGKFYFATSSTKEVYNQLKTITAVSFCSFGKGGRWVRISGQVEISNNLKLKEEVLRGSSKMKEIYKSPSNPEYILFYISKGEASLYSSNGTVAEKIKL